MLFKVIALRIPLGRISFLKLLLLNTCLEILWNCLQHKYLWWPLFLSGCTMTRMIIQSQLWYGEEYPFGQHEE
jgi:hypothetical protein